VVLEPAFYCRFLLTRSVKEGFFRNMAERDEKWPENVKGKFYVDEQCIDCDLCRETAPENFTRNEDGGYSLVYKQPISQEETDLCMEALEGCPVEAIGEDGEQ
jgi:ferredoxin